jgi:transposase
VTHNKRPDPKLDALKERGTLNPKPHTVTDELFRDSSFFDPRDLLQVKYEMLRRVLVDGLPVARSARAFGLSRPSFYEAQAAFERGGLPELLPRKRGPRVAHKLGREAMDFIAELRAGNASVSAAVLAPLLKERFGIEVHRRSIERALGRQEKKRR